MIIFVGTEHMPLEELDQTERCFTETCMRKRLRTHIPRLRQLSAGLFKHQKKRAGDKYLTAAHRAWRQAVVSSAGRRCEAIEDGRRCHKSEPEHRMFADHIVELSDGGAQFDTTNGQCLCGRHSHAQNHASAWRVSSCLILYESWRCGQAVGVGGLNQCRLWTRYHPLPHARIFFLQPQLSTIKPKSENSKDRVETTGYAIDSALNALISGIYFHHGVDVPLARKIVAKFRVGGVVPDA